MTIGDQYSVFEKQRLNEFLRLHLTKRQDFQWASLLVLTVSLGFTIHTKHDALKSPPQTGDVVLLTILWVFLLATLAFLANSFIKYFKYRQITADYILQALPSNEVNHDTTAVLLLKKMFGDTPKVLVKKKANWGYMLPYKKVSTPFDDGVTIGAMQSFFTNSFGGLSGRVTYLSDYLISNVIKINPSENAIGRFSFGFYTISDANYDELARLLKNREFHEYEWKSMSELLVDPLMMKMNPEMLNRLHSDNLLSSLPESFSRRARIWQNVPDQLRVIWNITTVCEFKCEFCATKRDQKLAAAASPSFESRIRIAEELLRIPGVRIDIAGGDPLKDPAARAAIMHILKYMASTNVTITSTGKAFDSMKLEELDDLLDRCNQFDISYDFPSGWGDRAAHRGAEYNRQNFARLKALKGRNAEATVLITLSQQNTADVAVLDTMIKELSELNPQHITLLRLMPVGKQRYSSYPKAPTAYDPMPAIEKFQSHFGDSVKLHCAFRANMAGEKCNMLRQKIGVDHDGNVFACAWAGYLDVESHEDNPFYLGNILAEGGIEAIFRSQRYEQLHRALSDGTAKGCQIFSFLESPTTLFRENHDPFCSQFQPADYGRAQHGFCAKVHDAI